MPRPIHVPQGKPGITTYTLGAHEEWTLLAVTFSLVPMAGAGADNFAWLDMRDPTGGIIYLQPLAPGDASNMFYSLAAGAEPFNVPNVTTAYVPQDLDGQGFNYVSQRFSPQTLYSGCTVNAYKTDGSQQPPDDPITKVSPFYAIPDLHLWVEDAGRNLVETVPVGPYMLVPGPNA